METQNSLLGKLLHNLISLETFLRAHLYETREEDGFVSHDKLNVGDRVPVNSYTDFKQLSELIEDYNNLQQIKEGKLDKELIIYIRDLLHHGRVLLSLESDNHIVVRFSKEKSGYVICEAKQLMDISWLKSAVNSIYKALTLVELSYPYTREKSTKPKN